MLIDGDTIQIESRSEAVDLLKALSGSQDDNDTARALADALEVMLLSW